MADIAKLEAKLAETKRCSDLFELAMNAEEKLRISAQGACKDLAANNARLREALESAALCYNPNGSYCWCHPSNQEGPHEPHCMWIRERFDETPQQSLEAVRDIRARGDKAEVNG